MAFAIKIQIKTELEKLFKFDKKNKRKGCVEKDQKFKIKCIKKKRKKKRN